MGHNVGNQAERSVQKSKKVALKDRTPEQILKEIRSNLASRNAVTPDDQRFLLAAYDTAIGDLNIAKLQLAATASTDGTEEASNEGQEHDTTSGTEERSVEGAVAEAEVRS